MNAIGKDILKILDKATEKYSLFPESEKEAFVGLCATRFEKFNRWKDVELTMSRMGYDKDHGVYVWNHKVWEYYELYAHWLENVEGEHTT